MNQTNFNKGPQKIIKATVCFYLTNNLHDFLGCYSRKTVEHLYIHYAWLSLMRHIHVFFINLLITRNEKRKSLKKINLWIQLYCAIIGNQNYPTLIIVKQSLVLLLITLATLSIVLLDSWPPWRVLCRRSVNRESSMSSVCPKKIFYVNHLRSSL